MMSARLIPPSQKRRNSMNSKRFSTPQRILSAFSFRSLGDVCIVFMLTSKLDGYSLYTHARSNVKNFCCPPVAGRRAAGGVDDRTNDYVPVVLDGDQAHRLPRSAAHSCDPRGV